MSSATTPTTLSTIARRLAAEEVPVDADARRGVTSRAAPVDLLLCQEDPCMGLAA
jgi:hypothetical protein